MFSRLRLRTYSALLSYRIWDFEAQSEKRGEQYFTVFSQVSIECRCIEFKSASKHFTPTFL